MRLLLLPLVFAALPQAQMPPPDPHPVLVPPAIRARFTADMRSKNVDDVMGLYAPDAIFASPGDTPRAEGAAAIRRLYEDMFQRYDASITLTPATQHAEGAPPRFNSIAESGAYSEDLRTRATGETKHLCGKYTFTYTKNPAGGWWVSRMDWTIDPCPDPAPN